MSNDAQADTRGYTNLTASHTARRIRSQCELQVTMNVFSGPRRTSEWSRLLCYLLNGETWLGRRWLGSNSAVEKEGDDE